MAACRLAWAVSNLGHKGSLANRGRVDNPVSNSAVSRKAVNSLSRVNSSPRVSRTADPKAVNSLKVVIRRLRKAGSRVAVTHPLRLREQA